MKFRTKTLAGLLVLLAAFAVSTTAQTEQRLEGQVVCCLDCWAKEDRLKIEYGTAEDLLAAKSCVEGGDPTLLAVREGDKFTFYQLKEGVFQHGDENWLEYIGKKVLINGTVQKVKKAQVLTVNKLEITADTIASREAKDVIGSVVALKLKDLFGTEQNLGTFKGRIVILNFWATYCLPCLEEMPDLAEIQNEFAAFGVQVIGASADEAEDRAKVLKFIKDTNVNFPIWMGASAADMQRFGLGGALPGTVIIDRTGRVVNVISGVIKKDDIKKQIEEMLAAPVAPAAEVVETEQPKEAKVSSVPS